MLALIGETSIAMRAEPSRCFLDLKILILAGKYISFTHDVSFVRQLGNLLTDIIYIPDLCDPAAVRTYPLMPVSERFPGPLPLYLASIIHHWDPVSSYLDALAQDLRTLELARSVSARTVDDTALKVLVGCYIPGDEHDCPYLVSLADVGLGLPQAMPVLAAGSPIPSLDRDGTTGTASTSKRNSQVG